MTKIKINPGDRFGKLTVVKRIENHITAGGNSIAQWECKCDCGSTVTMTSNNLKRNVSCGKCRGEDITGKRYGRLLVLGISPKKDGSRRLWKCRCDCGKEVDVSISKLNSGKQTSCGCWKAELNANAGNVVKKSIKTDEHSKKQAAINIKRYSDGWKSPTNTTGYTGVSFSRSNEKYQAYIYVNQKKYNLGYYYTAEEAAEIRKVAESKIYGDFLQWYAESYPEQWEKISKRNNTKK